MNRIRTRAIALSAAAGLALAAASALAAPAPGGKARGLGDMGSSRDPISIDADRLDVYDKEGRAVFAGNVVAVQGDTTMKCAAMDVFYDNTRSGAAAGGERTASAASGGLGSDSAIRKIDCRGPVVITTKTQTATGDRAEFDRVVNKVFLIGNAALSDGPNVTRGERVAYDLNTGVANVEGGRVRALIVPSSDKDKDKGKKTDRKER
ncbi:LptA/OstA family protein [Enterovirga sp.]|jgi:lipopolysaccharide export system protein LptA|uniref:LptA/OstA family protein n=1 Tax=Enterovirga sp. TaxID=2026350 RepID=UPI00260F39E3|nr:LptA/OstA family protein [Enterovirga sp.]MDB5590670.1 organic solvent tolerance protein OstA [Enterovirga sp.]